MLMPCSPSQGRVGGISQTFQLGKQMREKIRWHQNQEWKGGSNKQTIIHIFSKCKTHLDPMK